jgi:hypothetical protein
MLGGDGETPYFNRLFLRFQLSIDVLPYSSLNYMLSVEFTKPAAYYETYNLEIGTDVQERSNSRISPSAINAKHCILKCIS